MLTSLRYSQLMIRIGLAVVFFWFGIDKFIRPEYWVTAWVPGNIISLLGQVGLSGKDFIYLNAIFEILVGTSLISGMFMRLFSLLGAVFLVAVAVIHGLDVVIVRDVGLVGGLLALVFWPKRRYS